MSKGEFSNLHIWVGQYDKEVLQKVREMKPNWKSLARWIWMKREIFM